MFNLKKLAAVMLTAAVAFTAMPLKTPAYKFDPTETMFLHGVNYSMADGVSFDLFDINLDQTSELLVATETAKGDRLEIYGYNEGTKQPKSLKTMKNVTAVYGGDGRLTVEQKTKSTAKYTVLKLNGKGKLKTVRTFRAAGKKGNVTYYMNKRPISASKYKKAVKKLKKDGELSFITGDPWYDSDIIGVAETLGGDPGAASDFNLHVNYDYLMEPHIEKGGSYAGNFGDANDAMEKRLSGIIDGSAGAEGEDAKNVHEFYTLATDWETRNALGTAPLKKIIDDISGISSIAELNSYLSDPERSARYSFFSKGLEFSSDYKAYITYMVSDWYTVNDDSEEESADGVNRADFDYIVNAVLRKAGYTQSMIDQALKETYDFDDGMRENYLDDESSEADFTVSVSSLVKGVKNFPMKEMLSAYGLNEGEIIFYSPKVLSALDELYTDDNLSMLKSVLITKTAYDACKFLDFESAALANGYFDLLSPDEEAQDQKTDEEIMTEMDGQWEESITSSYSPLYAALANAYIENYLDKDAEAELREMTASIKAAFREILEEEDWLSEETKAAALKKLDAMTFTIGSPEEPIDTSYIAVDPTQSLLDTVMDLTYSRDLHSLSANGKLVRDGEVCRYDLVPVFFPLEVNARYFLQLNHFYITPAEINDAFFNKDMSYEKKLGMIGVTAIGHEITHGFDPDGCRYDENGTFIDTDYGFFSPEDAAAYQARVDKVIAYCDSFQFIPGGPLPGDIVKGEVIADIGGLKIGLKIAEKMEGFNYEEFFTSFAEFWREQTSLELEEYFLTDEHPCSVFRVNATVQQFEEFYKAFDVKEGDKMYLAPEDRLEVW